jgi:hypothetical protein
MLYILDSMEELKLRLLSDDFGKHLMGVEDLLQKHSLVEADINVLGERVKQVVQHSQRFLGRKNQAHRKTGSVVNSSLFIALVQSSPGPSLTKKIRNLRGASKIKLRNVIKKRMATARRLIFCNFSRYPLLI